MKGVSKYKIASNTHRTACKNIASLPSRPTQVGLPHISAEIKIYNYYYITVTLTSTKATSKMKIQWKYFVLIDLLSIYTNLGRIIIVQTNLL